MAESSQAAFARVKQRDFSLGIFQTTPQVEPFYQQLGCRAVNNRFYNSLAKDPDANPFWDPVAMRFPATSTWTESPIDLSGPGY